METLGPIFFCLIVPLIWTVVVFIAGRWSANNRIAIQRRADANGGHSPYYQDFDAEV